MLLLIKTKKEAQVPSKGWISKEENFNASFPLEANVQIPQNLYAILLFSPSNLPVYCIIHYSVLANKKLLHRVIIINHLFLNQQSLPVLATSMSL